MIDGQQRLTTLSIILSYFEEQALCENHLRYLIRSHTGEFLEKFIFTRKFWTLEQGVKPKHKDQYYIIEAANAVKEWSEEAESQKVLTDANIDFVKTILLQRTKLIVNEVRGNEEYIFVNINGAKAELDGADLLRAVQITHSAKERFVTFNESVKAEGNLINEFRVKMGMELDQINVWCGKKEVKRYLELLLPNDAMKGSKFDAKNFAINYLYRMIYEVNSRDENVFDFRFFEYVLNIKNNESKDDCWEIYEELKRIYNLMYDWYTDSKIFHYSAYLLSHFKGKALKGGGIVAFKWLHMKWQTLKSKRKFAELLKDKIVELLLADYLPDTNEDDDAVTHEQAKEELLSQIANLNRNWYNDPNLIKLLILQDVILCTRSKSFTRLSLEYFKINAEDKEHITCQTPNALDKASDKWQKYIKELIALGADEKELTLCKEQLSKDISAEERDK